MFKGKTIGACAREWRRQSNYTLQDIASRCGCTIQNITSFERGENESGKILRIYIELGFAVNGYADGLFICGCNRWE